VSFIRLSPRFRMISTSCFPSQSESLQDRSLVPPSSNFELNYLALLLLLMKLKLLLRNNPGAQPDSTVLHFTAQLHHVDPSVLSSNTTCPSTRCLKALTLKPISSSVSRAMPQRPPGISRRLVFYSARWMRRSLQSSLPLDNEQGIYP
jgi:hypothetical protein